MAKKKQAVATPLQAHTPGPWKVILGDAGIRQMSRIVREDKSDYQSEPMLIGYVIRESENAQQQAEDDANALLIAAAPDLLAACKAALEYAGGGSGGGPMMLIHNILAKAISKAIEGK